LVDQIVHLCSKMYTMLFKKITLLLTLLVVSTTAFSQVSLKKVTLSGKIIDKETSVPVEFTIITISKSDTKKVVNGGTADANGNFNIELNNGNYDIKFEFPGYKTQEKLNQNISVDTNLGNILFETESSQIETVMIRGERTTVDIKLDKKVYNVGQDLMVKGGTVSDVLDNIPSVAVDVEGNISLRGNESVRVLIDGKPSTAINVADALRMLPADAVDKVEVITNPSARYDAEGGGGILNIILKKGKNKGLNGTLIATAGDPRNNGISANINSKTDSYNLFTTISYNDRNNPGKTKINQENLKENSYIEERRFSDRYSKGTNVNFGMEVFLNKDKSATWTNSINYRNNGGNTDENVTYRNFNLNRDFINTRFRDNISENDNEAIEYSSNFLKKFKKDGHKLTIDASISLNKEDEFSNIYGSYLETGAFVSDEKTSKIGRQNRNLFQADYVLPLGKGMQFELGSRGSYTNSNSDYEVLERVAQNDPYTNIPGFTNNFEYIENITAVYTQFGTKFFNKLSVLAGLRFENTNLEINQLLTNDLNKRNYNNLFPSLFFTYELNDDSSLSLNYSKRISRPRDRFINPFSSYTSNTNLFIGDPKLNPAFTDAFDIGYLRKWDKITFSTSAYYNHTTDSFQTVRKESGRFIGTIPVIINSPFNLGEDNRIGMEVTVNYSLKKWWKLNSNVNYFYNETKGNYQFTNSNNVLVNQNFDFKSSTWSARITSKINLPYKIDWQTNMNYNAGQKMAQGKNKGIAAMNLAFSKDVLKDKATIAFNVNDVFNSRKRIQDLKLPTVNSYSEMQWRVRAITVSFTYRFNKLKTDKEPKPKSQDQENGGEF
jgi:outer membrane receptor for ferrienterochelin and colicins